MSNSSNTTLGKHRFSMTYLSAKDVLTVPEAQEYMDYRLHDELPDIPKRIIPISSTWILQQISKKTGVFPNAYKVQNYCFEEITLIPKQDCDNYLDRAIQVYKPQSENLPDKFDVDKFFETYLDPTASEACAMVVNQMLDEITTIAEDEAVRFACNIKESVMSEFSSRQQKIKESQTKSTEEVLREAFHYDA